jgi:hypothetical protein
LFNTHWGWWSLLAIPAIYYLALPIMPLLTLRSEAEPQIAPVEHEIFTLPQIVQDHFDAVDAELTNRGFTTAGSFILPSPTTNVLSILRVYVNRATRISAIANSMYCVVKTKYGTTVRQLNYVEFTTRFASGEVFNTLNSKEAGSFPPQPKTITIRIPWIKSAGQLGNAHDAILAAKGPGGQRILRVDSEFGGDVPAFLQTCMQEELENARNCGYMRLESAGTHYRLTFIGGYLMAWKLLFPWKQMLAWRNRRRVKRLLHEVGFNSLLA